MISKNKTILFLLFFSALLAGCSEQPASQIFTSVEKPQKDESLLRVAVNPDIPGFFSFNGQKLGYAYDLLDAYAQSHGLNLEIVPANTRQAIAGELDSGVIDMAATLQSYSTQERHTSIPLYETSYVILSTSKKMRTLPQDKDILTLLNGENILLSHGFTATRSYSEMAVAYPSAHFTSSARNTFELLESLINGRYSFLICEKSEARLGCSLIRNIEEVYQFDETVSVCMLLNDLHPEEGRRFASWMYDFRRSEAAAELHALYFDKGIYHRIVSGGIKNRPAGAISIYDDLFKQIAREENLDWRLVSAIAYSESKYNAYLVSPRGARGLMQVMPATAKAFHVAVDELMDPETNIRVAVQLIRKIEKSLKFSPETSQNDRTNIMLACYNGGIGHVTDARRLAVKHGGNPDSWGDVAQYLKLKAQPEYAEDEVVSCGVFNGASETLNFVNHVTGKYYAYCGRK